MTSFVKSALRLALLVFASQLITACGGSTTNTAVSTTTSPTIFYAHSVAFRNSSTVAWGYNAQGQLGIGSGESKSTPTLVNGIVGFDGIAVGGAHTLAFQNVSGAAMKSWGNNGFGQLGNDNSGSSSTPVTVVQSNGKAPLAGVKAVAAGGNHSLALRRDGTVWAWGYNGYGQLGVNSFASSSSAVKVEGVPGVNALPADIIKIAAGGSHSLAVDAQGRVWAWGYNGYGQLGDSTVVDKLVPVRVNFPVGVIIKEIAAGGSHSLALDSDNNVWAWGYNVFGQLGVAPQANAQYSSIPEKVQVNNIPITALKISAGLDHSLSLGTDGTTLYAWGFNGYGQLGRGGAVPSVPDATPQPTPQAVSGIPGTILDIRATGHYSLAFTTNGNVWAWGDNAYNQLGDGTTTSRSTPQRVSGYTFP